METFDRIGVSLVIGRREGYRFWDVDGRELLDLHLNGGTFNLGHRHPRLVKALIDGVQQWDVGNHHFPSEPRSLLAEDLAALSPSGALGRVVFTPSGTEAIDVAIRSARWATGRRRILSYDCAFHGRAGLGAAAGDDKTATLFHSTDPDFTKIPFDDLQALESELEKGDVAALLCEVIPATAGFRMPDTPDYHRRAKELCERHGALFIADEVQTGLGRTGTLWAVDGFGVVPDVLVTGKGLSGGLYPIAAVLLDETASGWMEVDGWAYISTFGGSELGCVVAREVLTMCTSSETQENVRRVADLYHRGLAELAERHRTVAEIRQRGLVIAIRLHHPWGGPVLARHLFANGVWAMFCGFEPSSIQWKPGLLVDDRFVDESLERLDKALQQAAGELESDQAP
ncbi:MAG: aminotransferase [Acidimicrobiales bacterium]|nr:MAG: aminotransferase [Acidimicrobiales bacterium]